MFGDVDCWWVKNVGIVMFVKFRLRMVKLVRRLRNGLGLLVCRVVWMVLVLEEWNWGGYLIFMWVIFGGVRCGEGGGLDEGCV